MSASVPTTLSNETVRVVNNLTEVPICDTREPLQGIEVDSLEIWGKSLKELLAFTERHLDSRLIYNSATMLDKKASLTHKNKLKGYKIWKEGYVKKASY